MQDSVPYNEPALLRAIAHSDASAFEQLVRAYQPRLFTYIYKTTQSRELALDLVQDLFLTLWSRREKLQEIREFNAYVFQIAHNLVYASLQQTAKQELVLTALKTNGAGLEATDDGGRLLLSKEIREYIQSLIGRMPARQREAFLLSREGGLGYEAIAAKMGVGRETVKFHIAEALKFLRTELKDQYGSDALIIIIIWQLGNL
ncbi:MAG TPA: sigma-70 family RNA polymerase sigma factor [Chitinophagaceae bacterium]|nr:sigma-70 family RNA polymerase sigma factor [Chitinophagaceae bacterium]